MDYHKKGFIVLVHVLVIHLFGLTTAQLFHNCVNNGNYTQNSAYQANLNSLLSSLSSNVDRYGFYNASVGENSDRVNAIVLCRGDVQHDTCRACVSNSTRDLLQLCPNYKEAIVWYDYCMLRYSNNSIVGTVITSPALYMWNTENFTKAEQFNEELRSLLDSLRGGAAYGGSLQKFSAGNRTAPDFQTIYALVQCTPDLSADDCSNCLITAAQRIPACCDGKRGGRVVGASCNLRFETYSFFNQTASEAGESPPHEGDKDTRTLIIIILVISIVGGLTVIGCIFFILRKKKRKPIDKSDSKTIEDISTVESLQYDFNTVSVATNHFSDANKLGQGGFGAVYKGELPNGQKLAVKRLSQDSGQGDLEFKNEVLLVAKLQHRNLVRLLGFCLEGTERLLIYEFMPNASLDKLMFDPVKQANLDWERRYKIILGVAKGLLYLHEDSRLRIIHRDLKASNVLLDEDLNPKISDFGMARLTMMDETQGNTSRIVGTYGYMAPEYALYGQFSAKSDVFSFGILVLEIVSGKMNNSFRNGGRLEDLSSYAWKNWQDGTAVNLIDPVLRANTGSMRDIVRCIHIGLLCIQEDVNDRPTMSSVILMLNSFSLSLPMPSGPAFLMHNRTGSNILKLDEEEDSRMLESRLLLSNTKSDGVLVKQPSTTDLEPR